MLGVVLVLGLTTGFEIQEGVDIVAADSMCCFSCKVGDKIFLP